MYGTDQGSARKRALYAFARLLCVLRNGTFDDVPAADRGNRAQIDGGKSAVEFLDANRVSTTGGGSPEIAVPGMTARAYETPDYLRAIVHANRNRLRITPEQRRAKLDRDIARLDRLINTELDALARVPYIIEVKNEGLEK